MMRDAGLRLKESLVSQGARDVLVGTGRTGPDDARVPALHVYLTRSERRRIVAVETFEGFPVVYHLGGKVRPYSVPSDGQT